MKRRTVLKGGGAWAAGAVLPRAVMAAGSAEPLFACCFVSGTGRYGAAIFTGAGDIRHSVDLPFRGHEIVGHPTRAHMAVIARRPGTQISIFDIRNGRLVHSLNADSDRHLYGHAVYSRNGAGLYVTENDFDAGTGVVAVYDPDRDYRKVAEFPSYGTGPHQIGFDGSGQVLIVANGGIRTHPDTGRQKLNIGQMEPCLTFIDAGSGVLRLRRRLASRLHKLSIRHFDAGQGARVAFAMQYEGDKGEIVPLAGTMTGAGRPEPVRMQPEVLSRLKQYTGSICFDASGTYFAVSCPRGNVVLVYDYATGKIVAETPSPDAAGIVSTDKPGEFLIACGDGSVLRTHLRENNPVVLLGPNPDRRWDNHLTRLEPVAG